MAQKKKETLNHYNAPKRKGRSYLKTMKRVPVKKEK